MDLVSLKSKTKTNHKIFMAAQTLQQEEIQEDMIMDVGDDEEKGPAADDVGDDVADEDDDEEEEEGIEK